MLPKNSKQIALKPQDLLVTLKLAVNKHREFTLTDLSVELGMFVSAVHGCVRRAELSRLLSRSTGGLRPIQSSVREFVIHGARYAFPGMLGSLSKGVPTAVAGPVLQGRFEHGDALPPVWPDAHGDSYGPMVTPLFPTVPVACKLDPQLYDVLTLLDALRVGAAREQKLAMDELAHRLA